MALYVIIGLAGECTATLSPNDRLRDVAVSIAEEFSVVFGSSEFLFVTRDRSEDAVELKLTLPVNKKRP